MSVATLVRHPIDVGALLARVESPAVGASTLFVGTVREVNDGRAVTGIDYSAYDAMAEREMELIAVEATERYPGLRIALAHRIGTLAVGDASVAVAAAHPRRAESFDGARYVVEELKRRVPIWKREHYADGTREWVDPTAATVIA